MQAYTVFVLMAVSFFFGFFIGSSIHGPDAETLKYVRKRAVRVNHVSEAKDTNGNDVLIWGDACTLSDKYAQPREAFDGKTVWVIKK